MVKGTGTTNQLINKCRLLLSPAYGILPSEDLARWMVEDKLKARLNPQLHKYILALTERKYKPIQK